MKLIVVRHGETKESVNQIIHGNLDGTLSGKGVEQAKKVAIELKNEHFDQVYSSDLGRCVNTAKYIMQYHPEPKLQLTSEIREMNFGTTKRRYSRSEWDKLGGNILERRFQEGESVLDMRQKVIAFTNMLLNKFSNQKILLVTHGGPIRILRSEFEGRSLEELYDEEIPNTSIWRFELKKPLDPKY